MPGSGDEAVDITDITFSVRELQGSLTHKNSDWNLSDACWVRELQNRGRHLQEHITQALEFKDNSQRK
jgi:hypothetical protein